MPAVEATLQIARDNIKKIRDSQEAPTFENTILEMDFAGEELDYVTGVYYNLLAAESDAEFKALAQTISPMLAEFGSSIMTDEVIFAKVKKVYEQNAPE